MIGDNGGGVFLDGGNVAKIVLCHVSSFCHYLLKIRPVNLLDRAIIWLAHWIIRVVILKIATNCTNYHEWCSGQRLV